MITFYTPQKLALLCYFLAICTQATAAIVALYQVKKVNLHHSGWLLLSLGLTVMVARRFDPVYQLIYYRHYSITDAVYALIISLLLMFGVLRIRGLFDLMHNQKIALDKLAKYDSLTGCLSRYAIFEQGLNAVERSTRLNRPIAILMIDIDSFKNINDTYGHSIGDQVLIQFVTVCKKSLRNIDIFGRFGGDEFIAILTETDLQIAQSVINRIHEDLLNADFIVNNEKLKVSASTGFVIYEPKLSSIEMPNTSKTLLDYLIHKADLNMYEIKKLRQNHIQSISNA